jgi:hypothetical protein
MAWKCPKCGEVNNIGDLAKCIYCDYMISEQDEFASSDIVEEPKVKSHRKHYKKQSKGGVYAVISSCAGLVFLLLFLFANARDRHENDFGRYIYLFPVSLILSLGGIMTALYNLDPGDTSARMGLGLGIIYFAIVGSFYFLIRFLLPSF